MSQRKPFVAGNWKMHNDRAATRNLLRLLKDELRAAGSRVDVAVAPPFTALETAADALRGTGIALAAQNVHHEARGAYTGEIAPSMLKELGVHHVILGHSERRHLFGETDAQVNLKVRATLSAGLHPILCIGETLKEREANRTLQVVTGSVKAGLEGVTTSQMADVVIAYEPVWAIGTGKTATPDQAQEVHAVLRELLVSQFGSDVGGSTRILYGGSVKPGNAVELFSREDIDGGLIGGASLRAEDFAAIVRAARV